MKKNIYYFNSCFCHVVLYGFIASTEFTSPIIWFLGATQVQDRTAIFGVRYIP